MSKLRQIGDNYLICNTDLIAEWHPTKNIDINMEELSAKSNKKVWWLCKNGHEWEATVAKRTDGRGCPYCSGSKVWVGVNDLESQHPELVKEWNYAKNDILPADVTAGSGKKVWWICKEGHEWESRIGHRTHGIGCPICSRKACYEGVNDLAHFNPNVAREWNYEKNGDDSPNTIAVNSNKCVWWKCDLGHEWKTSVNNRRNGAGCPYCSGKAILSGFNDLAAINPKLAEQWDYNKNGSVTPNKVAPKSNKAYWWICEKGHEFKASVNNRAAGKGCPICSNHQVLVGYNDLESVCPDVAIEWDLDKNKKLPSEVVYGSGANVWWKCQLCGHEWKTKVISRFMGTGCPHCYARNRTSFPEQAIFYYIKKAFPDSINRYTEAFEDGRELDIFIPSMSVGIEYDGAYWHKGNGEKEVAKYISCKNKKIKLIRIKEALEIWDTLSCDFLIYVDDDLDGAIEKIEQYLSVTVNHDIRRDRRDILEMFYSAVKGKSLSECHPDLVTEWNYEKNGSLLPEMFYEYSNETVWWRCKQGHEWEAIISNRTHLGRKCPYCTGQKPIIGENDLLTLFPQVAIEWDYRKNKRKPYEYLPSSNIKVWWKCEKCNNEWNATISHRTHGRGCPECGRKKRSLLRRKTSSEFLAEVEGKNENIEIISPYISSSIPLECRCKKCDFLFQMTSTSLQKGVGCPACNNRTVYKGHNDLLTVKPEIAIDWAYDKNGNLRPEGIIYGSGKKVWWRCHICLHEWEDSVSHRSEGRNCPNCKKMK